MFRKVISGIEDHFLPKPRAGGNGALHSFHLGNCYAPQRWVLRLVPYRIEMHYVVQQF